VNARKIFGRPWAEIPLPLRVYLWVGLVQVPLGVAHGLASSRPWVALLVLPLWLFFAVGVLRGWRWLWILIVFGGALGILLPPYRADAWSLYIRVSELVDIGLLLWPSSYRYVWRRGTRMVIPREPTIDTAVAGMPASERPDGWFLDPSDPNRMRYWHGESGAWIGRAKTPRKIRRDPANGSIEADAPGSP